MDSSTAVRIAVRASEEKAERVAFPVDGGFLFADCTEAAILAAVGDHQPAKYKLQSVRDGRWADVTRYEDVSPVDRVMAAIRSGKRADIAAFDDAALATAASRRPRSFDQAVARIHRDAIDQFAKTMETTSLEKAQGVLELLAPTESTLVAYAARNVVLHAELAPAALDDVQALERLDALAPAAPGANVADLVARGKYLSLTDRDTARRTFAEATAADHEGVLRSSFLDLGAWSYFDQQEVETPAMREMASRISRSFEWIGQPHRAAPQTVAFSVDPGFLRIYGPTVLTLAHQVPDVDFTLILCGDRALADKAIADAEAFREALRRLNRSGEHDNVNYAFMPVFSEVVESTTFYACARFFALDALLADYDDVYLLDADVQTLVDPLPFLKSVRGIGFAAHKSSGFNALSPWRRMMAGNIPVGRATLDAGLVATLQRYLSVGLSRPNSWMLDQNALAYASEQHPETFGSLTGYRRPFAQPAFRSSWERRYKVANKAPDAT
ncbi:MAG: hypothetical protein ABGX90_00180 [Brachybacterium sp.]|uniref:hypothetical protein n=1 Tax=Brachybacterium sp. TaxID=1891286 RepID=UPI003242624D